MSENHAGAAGADLDSVPVLPVPPSFPRMLGYRGPALWTCWHRVHDKPCGVDGEPGMSYPAWEVWASFLQHPLVSWMLLQARIELGACDAAATHALLLQKGGQVARCLPITTGEAGCAKAFAEGGYRVAGRSLISAAEAEVTSFLDGFAPKLRGLAH